MAIAVGIPSHFRQDSTQNDLRIGYNLLSLVSFGGVLGFTVNEHRKRVEWLDVARGIGIILVVMGHAERGLVSAHIADGNAWSLFDLSLYTFHMPLFMLLAGINVKPSLARGRETFVLTRLRTIAYPYVLWSLIQGSLLVLLSGMTNGGSGEWSRLLMIGWKPISPFWFLYALMAYMLLVAAVGLRARVLIPLAAIGLIASGLLTGESLVHQLAYMFSFFVIGTLASDAIKRWAPAWYWIAILAALWLAAYQIVPSEGETPYLTPWAFPAALAGIAVILCLAQACGGMAKEFLAAIGRISMTIYVMHILATAGTRIVLTKLGIHAPAGAYFAACTIVGIAGPACAHVVLERLGLLPLLGLSGKLGGGKPSRSASAEPIIEANAPVRAQG